ncbi:metallophosphoesterase family protein [Pseudomarimonas arenosa]|uniref:Metallophosphoesterase n=1 Tax=Pseudomarimonas arenosa TaxID=2774145 RepID=A0AAW3ZKA5_9GAMM|nr:metallophosphoesterase family protein [Pseudomarimonas arenosa]MBD8525890.1 metallophosphoesterase [Pseudomarimonas arenosa]
MRLFAISDIHVDYDDNAKWVGALSRSDYRDDTLMVAGDISDRLPVLRWCLRELSARFRNTLFVPGNHELWVVRDTPQQHSLDKFELVAGAATEAGASMQPLRHDDLMIVPLLGWYDFSFGFPCDMLRRAWMDFIACRWPNGMTEPEVSRHFSALNPTQVPADVQHVVTFSHFMPRLDLMPAWIPQAQRKLYPVLGATRIDSELRQLGARTHVYGHTHINRQKTIDGITYINNAFGYPHEHHFGTRGLLEVSVAQESEA